MEKHKLEFLEFFDNLTKDQEIPENINNFINYLKHYQFEEQKIEITKNGIAIVEFLQQQPDLTKMLSAKEIAEGMNKPVKQVSGAMKKLVEENYVLRLGKVPYVYALKEKGMKFKKEDN